jgi:hypothetical protein
MEMFSLEIFQTRRKLDERLKSNEGKKICQSRVLPVIPATQEAEIRRVVVRSQSRQIVCETLS